MSVIRIEVCVDSMTSLQAAADACADRIELCCALELGGLTPGTGLLLAAAELPVPVHAMIRPRAGDFAFTRAEVDLMVDDVHACREAGLAGVVIGAASDGWLDEAALEALVDAAGGLSVTLHRVFDLVDDPVLAIDTAADLGIARILTSGGATTTQAGIEAIRRHVEQADGRLAIMAGGGIHAGNAVEIVRHTGVQDIHGSFSLQTRRYAASIRHFSLAVTDVPAETDIDTVRAVSAVLDNM